MSDNNAIVKVQNQLHPFKENLQKIINQVNELKVNSPDDLKVAEELLNTVREFEKDLDAKRKDIVGPLNDFVKQVNSLAKGFTGPVDTTKKAVKAKILEYNKKLQEEAKKRQEEEAQRLAEAEAKKQAEEEAKLAELKKEDPEKAKEKAKIIEQERQEREEINSQTAGLSTAPKVKGITKRWTYEIVNEDKVPRIFCSPDSKKINAEIKAGKRIIAGLKIYEVEDVR